MPQSLALMPRSGGCLLRDRLLRGRLLRDGLLRDRLFRDRLFRDELLDNGHIHSIQSRGDYSKLFVAGGHHCLELGHLGQSRIRISPGGHCICLGRQDGGIISSVVSQGLGQGFLGSGCIGFFCRPASLEELDGGNNTLGDVGHGSIEQGDFLRQRRKEPLQALKELENSTFHGVGLRRCLLEYRSASVALARIVKRANCSKTQYVHGTASLDKSCSFFMFRIDSSLFFHAADVVGKFAPCQGVELAPHPCGQGVTVTALADSQAMVMIGYDPKGVTDEPATVFLPTSEIKVASKGIKTAERELTIEDGLATVTTYYQSHSVSKSFPIAATNVPFPAVRAVIARAVQYWGSAPAQLGTSGRYDLPLLLSAIKAMADATHSVVVAPYPDGPLRLQREDLSIVIMLMPQVAVPIPPLPDWLLNYGG